MSAERPFLRSSLALLLVAALAAALGALQVRFDDADVREAIRVAMGHHERGAGLSVLEALAARGEGDPRCDGAVVSQLHGDVLVRCATPARPEVSYRFRVRLDGKRPPRAEGAAAEALVEGLVGPDRE